MFGMRTERREVTTNMRQLRQCCIEILLANTQKNFADFDQTKEFVKEIEDSISRMEDAKTDIEFSKEASNFSEGTMTKIISVFKEGHKEFISNVTEELLTAIEEAAAEPLNKADEKPKARFKKGMENLKTSIRAERDTEFMSSITRFFSYIMSKDEVHQCINFTIENRARVLSSFLELRKCLSNLASIFEKVCADPIPFIAPVKKEEPKPIEVPKEFTLPKKVSKLLPPVKIKESEVPKSNNEEEKKKLLSEINLLKSQVHTLTADLEEAQEESGDSMLRIVELEGNFNEEKIKNREMYGKLSEIIEENNQLMKKLGEASSFVDSFKEKFHCESVDEVNERFGAIIEENERLNNRIKEIEALNEKEAKNKTLALYVAGASSAIAIAFLVKYFFK